MALISPGLVFVHVANDSELFVAVEEDVGDDEASITSEEEWHNVIMRRCCKWRRRVELTGPGFPECRR